MSFVSWDLLCDIIAGMDSAAQLRNLLHQRQIVQHYPPSDQEDLLPLPVLSFAPKRNFFEEQIFEGLDRTAIVEDYLPGTDYSRHTAADFC